jgi:hypothetical protein
VSGNGQGDALVVIPEAFWRGIRDDEVARIVARDGMLDAEQCKRVWRLLGRTDPPPRVLQLSMRKEDAQWAISRGLKWPKPQ